MLSIRFFSDSNHPPHSIRIVDQFYEWLAHSDFSKVGSTDEIEIEIEEEIVSLPLVRLDDTIREGFINVLSDTFFQETRQMLGALEQAHSTELLSDQTYRLKKLLEMLDCFKNPAYQYLQRE